MLYKYMDRDGWMDRFGAACVDVWMDLLYRETDIDRWIYIYTFVGRCVMYSTVDGCMGR